MLEKKVFGDLGQMSLVPGSLVLEINCNRNKEKLKLLICSIRTRSLTRDQLKTRSSQITIYFLYTFYTMSITSKLALQW